jgi:hypothetical protein
MKRKRGQTATGKMIEMGIIERTFPTKHRALIFASELSANRV